MKKVLICILFFALLVTGCGLKQAEATEEVTNTPIESNKADNVLPEKKETIHKEEMKKEHVPVLQEEKKDIKPKKELKQENAPVQAIQPKSKSLPSKESVPPVTQEKPKVVPSKGRVYKDPKHKFTLQFPEQWKDVKVNYRHEQQEGKFSINFTVALANEEHTIASIIGLDKEALVTDYVSSGVFHQLGKVNNITYVYIRRSEAPDKFYQDIYKEELKKLQQFVHVVPQVMQTFRFIP